MALGSVKVLIAVAQPPLPEGGSNGRSFIGLLRGLLSHDVQVQCIAARQWFARPEDPPPDLPVRVVPVAPGEKGWAFQVQRWRRPRGYLARTAFGEAVREAARHADLLHLEEVDTSWCDEGTRVPSLVHLHYRVLRDRSLGLPWQRDFRGVAEFAMAERAAIRRHRYLMATSPLVAAELRSRAPHAQVALASLSVDPSYYPRAPLDGPPVVGMLGFGSWPTTADAFRRLVATVWPRVRARVPEARLLLAGRGVAELQGLHRAAGVEVVGEVPRAGTFLASLSVLVFPLRRGSGMKMKVLESIAVGLPVVTTPAGAEGIDGGHGIIVEDDDSRLAEAVARLLVDQDERKQRGAAAREAFDRRYAPSPATEPVVDLYRRMQGSS